MNNARERGAGCGASAPTEICVKITPTTGGDFQLTVNGKCTVEELKKAVAQRLKVPRDRICLLFRNKQLQEGAIIDQYGIGQGAAITLVPNVETGLLNQRSEIDIMQALDSLNETQVNEFLSGKSPLNLSMRLGNHIMLIQLQLSTMTPLSSTSQPVAAPLTPPLPPPSPPLPSPPTPLLPPTTSLDEPSTCELPTFDEDSMLVEAAPTPPPSLIQASRNLQHTLKRLSSDLFSGKEQFAGLDHRENIYSGTFRGALNPALQDNRGRPRRHVSTIVHILNDLLCSAVPEFRQGDTTASAAPDEAASISSVEHNATVPSSPNAAEMNTATSPGGTTASSAVAAATSAAANMQDDQNLRTRGKLEQLRLVMGKRREQRRERRRQNKPYTTAVVASGSGGNTGGGSGSGSGGGSGGSGGGSETGDQPQIIA